MPSNGRQIIDTIGVYAEHNHCLWFHLPDSRRAIGSPGFPDLVIVGRGGLLAAEVKAIGDQAHPAQWRWGAYMSAAGINWQIWRPADLASGRVETEIAAIKGE